MPLHEETAIKGSQNVDQYLKDAEYLCKIRGVKLTHLRRTLLEILLETPAPVKAYEFIDILRVRGQRITAASIYRILDFLQENGLVHRINALNAFVPCTGVHHSEHNHHALMLICSDCQKTQEIDDHNLFHSIEERLGSFGMRLQDHCIEIQGVCADCSKGREDY